MKGRKFVGSVTVKKVAWAILIYTGFILHTKLSEVFNHNFLKLLLSPKVFSSWTTLISTSSYRLPYLLKQLPKNLKEFTTSLMSLFIQFPNTVNLFFPCSPSPFFSYKAFWYLLLRLGAAELTQSRASKRLRTVVY